MRRMRTWFLGGAVVAVLTMVGACSQFVPPIPVDDLFGLDGLQVDLVGSGGAVSTMAGPKTTAFSGSLSAFVDSDGFDVPAFINAALMQESVVIGANVQITVLGEDARSELTDFTLTGGQIALQVRVDGTLIATASGSATFSPALALTRGDCSYALNTVCTYVASVNADQHAIVVTATAASAKAVFDAMRDGETLEVSGTFSVTLGEPGLTNSAIVRVTLNTKDGSIKF
jgi:hypothetical protein